MFAEHGVSARCDFVAADFFQNDFPYGRTRIWPHMTATGRLLVTDIVLSSERNVHDTYPNCLDLAVMTQVGGMERTESECRSLLAEVGFDVLQVVELGMPQ